MYQIIAEHEFIENDRGEVMLLVPWLSDEPPPDPVLLIDPISNTAFLHRSESEIYEISGINEQIMPKLRQTDTVLVTEMDGEEIAHAYDTITGAYQG